MKLKFKAFIFCSSFLILYSCVSPRPITRLQAVDKDKTWLFGSETVTKEQDSMKVSMTFKRSYGEKLIFDLKVSNRSQEDILISPEVFFYESMNRNSSKKSQRKYAFNPEYEILKLDKSVSRAEAAETNQAIAGLVVGLAGAALDVAASVSDNTNSKPETEEEKSLRRIENKMDDEMTRERYENTFSTLEKRRKYWENKSLRKTTLKSKKSIKGQVLFLRNQDAYEYKFYIPTEKTVFVFNYKQLIFQP